MNIKKKIELMMRNSVQKEIKWEGDALTDYYYVAENKYWYNNSASIQNGKLRDITTYNVYFLLIPKGATKITLKSKDNIGLASTYGYGICTYAADVNISPYIMYGGINLKEITHAIDNGYRFIAFSFYKRDNEVTFQFSKE